MAFICKKKNVYIDNTFHFFSSLLEPNAILKDLLSPDNGKVSPNPSNEYQLSKVGVTEFSSQIQQTGLPYYWVQWICGMNYLPHEEIQSHVPDPTLSVKHFQSVIKTIKSRLVARLSLVKQLQQLGNMTICLTHLGLSYPPTLNCIQSIYIRFCSTENDGET